MNLCVKIDQPVGFFKSHRDGYRTLELSCMKNKGGRYVELSDYHSGSQQGNIRIPEGRLAKGGHPLLERYEIFSGY
jgi:hypothetical protein